MELHAAVNQQLKDAIRWLEESANDLERFGTKKGSGGSMPTLAAPSSDDWLQIQHIRTIIAAVKSLQAEVEALKR